MLFSLKQKSRAPSQGWIIHNNVVGALRKVCSNFRPMVSSLCTNLCDAVTATPRLIGSVVSQLVKHPLWVAALGASLSIFFLITTLGLADGLRASSVAHLSDAATAKAQTLSLQLARDFAYYDFCLDRVQEARSIGNEPDVEKEMRGILRTGRTTIEPYLSGVYLLAPNGHIEASFRTNPDDSDYVPSLAVPVHSSSFLPRDVLSKPFVRPTASPGKTLVAFSRRLSRVDHSDAGAIVVVFDVRYFDRVARDRLKDGESVGITLSDGTVIYKSPEIPEADGIRTERSDVAPTTASRAYVPGLPLVVLVSVKAPPNAALFGKESWTTNIILVGVGGALPILWLLVAASARRRVSAQATLSRLARTDALTGLANRRALDQSLRDLVRGDAQQAECVSLLFADIDRFKHYNDTYGHVAGDAALVKVAECLKSLPVRAGASARYGGEEFVVLLPGVRSSDALQIAELLRDRVYQLAIEHAGSPLGVLTISVGVATSDAVTQCDPLRLLKHADQALYEAKSIGRNSVVCYRERYDAENSAAA